MAIENPTPIRPLPDKTISDLREAQEMFQGLEASAKVLSTCVELGDGGADLVAYCESMAREALRGWLLAGELIETLQGSAS